MNKTELTVIYGMDPFNMTKELLKIKEPFRNLDKNISIALKPNLVKSAPSSSGATTSSGIVKGIIEHLKENGFNNILIMESSWIGDSTERAFKVCGYDKISAEYDVPLIDLKNDQVKKIKCNRELTLNICKKALSVDFLVNLPVLKAHCQTKLTCALKNLKGCIPDSEKKRFHAMGLHKPIAFLNKAIKTNLIIVDGIMGDLTHEEGGNPVEMARIIFGNDPVLIDSYAAGLLGFNTGDIPYIKMAETLGLGTLFNQKTYIEEINRTNMPRVKIQHGAESKLLANMIEEKEACSPCYGNLIHALQRLKESGKLANIPEKISIGQGFTDKNKDGCGIGKCTAGFTKHLGGCPPETKEIVRFLNNS